MRNEGAENLTREGDALTAEAIGEVGSLKALIEELFTHALNAYRNGSRQELASAEEIEEQIDLFTERMAWNHVQRLTEGSCTPNAGAQYLELSSDAERVADHLINVAKTIRQ